MSFLDAGFLRGIATSLGVKGVQSAPEELDLSRLTPQVELGHETQRVKDMVIMLNRTAAINGLTNYSMALVGPSTAWAHPVSGSTPTVVPPSGYATMVLGVEIYVLIPAAVLAAEIGYWIGFKVEYMNGAGDRFGPVAAAGREIVDHVHRYHMSDNQNVPRTVIACPNNFALVAYVSTRHETHQFPAGATINCYLTYSFVAEGAKVIF